MRLHAIPPKQVFPGNFAVGINISMSGPQGQTTCMCRLTLPTRIKKFSPSTLSKEQFLLYRILEDLIGTGHIISPLTL